MSKNTLLVGLLVVVLVGIGIWAFAGMGAHRDTGTETLDEQTDEQTDTLNESQPPVTSGENPTPGDEVHGLPPEPAAAEARKDLAGKLSVSEGSIVIMNVTEAEWTDGCLGLGGPAESCLMALVPGFEVELLAQGKTYIYRTDQTGATVRAETEI